METQQNIQTRISQTQEANEAFLGPVHEIDGDQVTGFTEQGTVETFGGKENKFLELIEANADVTQTSIGDVMARFTKVDSYDFTGLYQSGVNKYFAAHPGFNKIYGFLGFTATMHCKVTWNADPMIQGMYILAYVPPYVSSPKSTDAYALPVFLSGCQHVIINVSEKTSAELMVPYVGERTHIPTVSDAERANAQVGNFVIYPITPVVSAVAPVKLVASIFFRAFDLQTYGLSGVNEFTFTPPPVVQASVGVVEALRKTKVISTTGGVISDFLNGGQNPGYVRKTLGWLVGSVTQIVDILGFSKPSDLVNMRTQQIMSYADAVTADGTFHGPKCAVNSVQEVDHVDLSGRDIDEMLITNVLSRPNFAPTFKSGDPFITLTKAQASGDVLRSQVYNPLAFARTIPEGFQPTQMGYLARMFKFWRGGIKIHLRPICTKFHAARIRVCFFPTVNDVTAASIQQMPYIYTHIVDIRDATTYEFTIPYVATTPWRSTDVDLGSLVYTVENVLVAPENVADTIHIAQFVSAGDDFEFAAPGIQDVTVGPWQQYAPVPTVQANDGWLSHSNSDITDFQLARSSAVSVNAHKMAVGDPVRSLRAVLKKFWTSRVFTTPAAQYVLSAEPNSIRGVNRGFIDIISYVGWLYTFHRGGMRWLAQNYYPARVSVTNDPNFTSQDYNGVTANLTAQSYQLTQTFGVGIVEPTKFELPYYNDCVAVNHWAGGRNITHAALVVDYYLGAATASFQRAVADDFAFGYLVGAPTLYNQAPPPPSTN